MFFIQQLILSITLRTHINYSRVILNQHCITVNGQHQNAFTSRKITLNNIGIRPALDQSHLS